MTDTGFGLDEGTIEDKGPQDQPIEREDIRITINADIQSDQRVVECLLDKHIHPENAFDYLSFQSYTIERTMEPGPSKKRIKHDDSMDPFAIKTDNPVIHPDPAPFDLHYQPERPLTPSEPYFELIRDEYPPPRMAMIDLFKDDLSNQWRILMTDRCTELSNQWRHQIHTKDEEHNAKLSEQEKAIDDLKEQLRLDSSGGNMYLDKFYRCDYKYKQLVAERNGIHADIFEKQCQIADLTRPLDTDASDGCGRQETIEVCFEVIGTEKNEENYKPTPYRFNPEPNAE